MRFSSMLILTSAAGGRAQRSAARYIQRPFLAAGTASWPDYNSRGLDGVLERIKHIVVGQEFAPPRQRAEMRRQSITQVSAQGLDVGFGLSVALEFVGQRGHEPLAELHRSLAGVASELVKGLVAGEAAGKREEVADVAEFVPLLPQGHAGLLLTSSTSAGLGRSDAMKM